MTPVLALTHVGAVTALGSSVETAFVYRAQGVGLRSAALAHPETGEALLAGVVPTLDGRLVGTERALALGKLALDDLNANAGSAYSGLRLRVWLCLDEWLAERDATGAVPSVALGRALRTHARAHFGEQVDFRICAAGAASPGRILGDLVQALASNEVDAVLLGGVHTDLCPVRVRALHAQLRLYTPEGTEGVVAGEGAAFVALVPSGRVGGTRARPRAFLHAFGAGQDKARPENDASSFEALGLTLAVRQATEHLSATARVGWQINDLGFEPYRVSEWISVMARTQPVWEEPQISDSPTQRLGNLGAAAVPIQLALAHQAFQRGYAPHPRLLCLAGSDDGVRTALLVEGEPA
jgi:3-oxoacyl-[acyl-carrier-protein] synthase-1